MVLVAQCPVVMVMVVSEETCGPVWWGITYKVTHGGLPLRLSHQFSNRLQAYFRKLTKDIHWSLIITTLRVHLVPATTPYSLTQSRNPSPSAASWQTPLPKSGSILYGKTAC